MRRSVVAWFTSWGLTVLVLLAVCTLVTPAFCSDTTAAASIPVVADSGTTVIRKASGSSAPVKKTLGKSGKKVLRTPSTFPDFAPGQKKWSKRLLTLTRMVFHRTSPVHLVVWVKNNAVKLSLLVLSVVIIISTCIFYVERREKVRFMTTTRLSIMDKEVQRACRFIEKNYVNSALDLAMICSALVTGEAFLEALFEKELGLPIDGFIRQVRINRVKILLHKYSAVTVEEAVLQSGFTTTETFLADFEAVTGTSFKKYQASVAPRAETAG